MAGLRVSEGYIPEATRRFQEKRGLKSTLGHGGKRDAAEKAWKKMTASTDIKPQLPKIEDEKKAA